MSKWNNRFIELAKLISTWSLDPSTQVGSVIVDENRRIISTGYNGFPKGVKDDERLENRELKYDIILHAEMNALLYAKQDLSKCTIYVHPFMPCSRCAAAIIQSGIKCVVAPKNENPRWKDSFDLSNKLFEEAGVTLELL